MASNTRDIRRKIKSVNSTMQITKAFELVSTAKLRRARNLLETTAPYFELLRSTIEEVFASERSIQSKYIGHTEAKKPLIIVLTADKGLCGGLNIGVIKKTLEISDLSAATYFTFGKKGNDFFLDRGGKIEDSVLYMSEKPNFENAKYAANKAVQLFKEGKVDSVFMVYTKFQSTITQVPDSIQLLPLEIEKTESKNEKYEVINYSPSPEDVIAYVIPKYVEGTIFAGLVNSAASEQAARRVAMENATENAEEIISDLTLSFNRARQAVITQEISEIVGGAEALK